VTEQATGGNVFKCEKECMTGEVMFELLREGVGQETTAILKELGMLYLDALKCHLTGKLKSLTCNVNTDLEIIL
jgi:hypothetical protein